MWAGESVLLFLSTEKIICRTSKNSFFVLPEILSGRSLRDLKRSAGPAFVPEGASKCKIKVNSLLSSLAWNKETIFAPLPPAFLYDAQASPSRECVSHVSSDELLKYYDAISITECAPYIRRGKGKTFFREMSRKARGVYVAFNIIASVFRTYAPSY